MVVCYFILSAFVLSPLAALNPKDYTFLKTQMNDEKHAVAFNKLLNSIVKVNQKRLDALKKLTKLQVADYYPTLDDSLGSDTMRSEALRTDRRHDSDESDSDSDEKKNIIYLVIPDSPAPSTQNPPPIPLLSSVAAQNKTLSFPGSQRSKHSVQSQPGLNIPPDTQRTPMIQDMNDLSKIRGPNETFRQVSISRDGLDALRKSIERSCKSGEAKRCKNACRAAVSKACEEFECKKRLRKKLKKTCKKECKSEFSMNW